MFTYRKKYFLLTILFLVIEILIAVFVRDDFIRPYGGDFLVVFLIYFFYRSFCSIRPLLLSISVLLFAYAVEVGQYFKLVEILGLKRNQLAEIIIGTGFSWWDMLAYTLGTIAVFVWDKFYLQQRFE